MGRIERIQYYETSDKRSRHPLKEKTFHYDTFHKMSEISEWQDKTIYIYDESGRPASSRKENQKIEFIYDALGRVHGVKKWKSSNAFTLEIKEYDLLDRVIEERTENENGRVLLKKKYVYNDAGQLFQVIGYPQNQESILAQYEYDGFGRLSKTENGVGSTAQIFYDDFYINEWGQKGQKRILIDPLGNSREEIFDNEGNLVKTSQKDSSGQLLSCVETSCDFSRNKIYERAAVIGATALAKNYETEWSFNQKDQLESITLALDTPEEYFTRFKYNSDGELKAQYLPDSKEPISFRYNSDGNVESVFYKEGQKEVEFELYYDLHQNLAKIKKDDFHWVDYRFNAHDLLACETIQDEFGPYQINCTYDGEGKLQTLHFPDQSFVEYSYEGPFVKSATRFSEKKKELYTYEVASRDLMGNILEEILPGALGKKKQRWDKAGRRVEITADLFQTQVLDYDSLDLLKKKETALGQKKYPTDYDYNALHQLIFEKGEIKHQYSYDSLGNRLQKDASIYTVNEINQLVDTGIASYTFLPGGNIATKTIDAHTWTYQSNPLNQIVSIEDPDQNTISFTYDLTGKRLSKRIDAKDKKAKTFRFFYLGNTEIGCLDEEGEIVELKIPSDPNHPEAPCIAIEIKQEIYVPLHDLQGNIARLFDYKTGKLIENYRYSAFGEEEITNEMGLRISESTISNPWRYRGKRVDQEIGLIYFGKRYYDPEIGRWISPDPIGAIDGPNLYAFVHNNPIKYVDYFGLSSTIDTNCDCTQHHHPGWHYADRDCVCICGRNGALVRYPGKIGIELASILGGIGHGVVDFMISSLHDLQMMAAYIGSEELEMSLRERMGIIEAVEQSQVHRIDAVESLVMDLLSIDSSDMDYQSFRSKTILGLEIGSMIAGGYGLVKGAIGLGRLVRGTIRASRVVKSVGEIESFVNRGTSFAGSKRAPFEYAPYQKIRNKSAIINGREYSGHSLDRMQDRGFMPSFIESTLETGRVSPAEFPGELEYYDSINRVKVIVGRNRQIVTVIPGRG
ncbi:MAG: RHS repeat-associated core domain-containing protein [Chlamydiota bacterium]